MAEEPSALSIGAVFGGPMKESAAWHEAILRSRDAVAAAGGDALQSPLNVNVVFHVPGSVLGVDFDGVRTGTFSAKDHHLMVQVALPREAPSEVDAYLRRCIVDALHEVERWNARPKRRLDLGVLHEIVSRL